MIKELSHIPVWEQYKANEGIKEYFKFFGKYINDNYKNLFYVNEKELGYLTKEFTILQSESDFLVFYLKSIFNIQRPHYLVDKQFWDTDLFYDSYFKYDTDGTAELVPIYLLKKIWWWIYNIKYTVFSIPSLAMMIAEFCEVSVHEVDIEQHKTRLKDFIVKLPYNRYSKDFRIVYNTYRNIFNLPIGCSLVVYLKGMNEEESLEGDETGE